MDSSRCRRSKSQITTLDPRFVADERMGLLDTDIPRFGLPSPRPSASACPGCSPRGGTRPPPRHPSGQQEGSSADAVTACRSRPSRPCTPDTRRRARDSVRHPRRAMPCPASSQPADRTSDSPRRARARGRTHRARHDGTRPGRVQRPPTQRPAGPPAAGRARAASCPPHRGTRAGHGAADAAPRTPRLPSTTPRSARADRRSRIRTPECSERSATRSRHTVVPRCAAGCRGTRDGTRRAVRHPRAWRGGPS